MSSEAHESHDRHESHEREWHAGPPGRRMSRVQLSRLRRGVAQFLRGAADDLDAGRKGLAEAAAALRLVEQTCPFESSAGPRFQWRMYAAVGGPLAGEWLAAWMRSRAAEIERNAA